MSAITAKASRKMKKYAVLTREPRCFLGSFDFSWEQRKLGDIGKARSGVGFPDADQGGLTGVPFFKVSDMNSDGNENEMTVANNYVTAEQIADHRWSPITELPAIFFAKVGAAVMLNRKRLCRFPFLLDNNTMAYSLSPTKWDADFAKALFGTVDLTSLVQVGALPSYNAGDVESMEIYLPSLLEQEQIGAYFNHLDNLITLHQRKCALLFSSFQALISMMFTTSTFSWEQRKFDEVFDCTVPNNTLSRAELSYDEGTVLNVHYGDVLIKYGSVLDVQKDDIPRIPHRCREDFNGALLQDGDVIIADTAEDETTGKACEIGNLQGSAIVSGLHTMVCRPRNRMALGYLGYYLNSNAYHYQLLPLMQGIKVLSLSRSNIQKTSVSYPIAVKEQQLIAYYFRQLDNLITLHQRKCISFTVRAGRLISTVNKKRITSSWEQRKLGELVDRVVRKNTNNESTLPLTISAQYGLVDQITYFNNRVASRDVSNYYLVLNGEFAYNKSTSDGYPFGAVKRLDLYEKGVLSTLYIVFAPKKEQQIDSDYLTVFFDTDRWHKGVAERAAEGARNHGLLNISAEDFFDIDLSVPKDIVEQKQIGAFIRQLDNLITLHQRKPFLMKWRTSDANRNQTNRLVL